ncbi:MAG: bacillithiol biosynthesis cysteine-adding enzyme BshC [Terrimonas sp.]|nr:bacillithiol biosynthesis cysteine-adding enzyme BshC [Terrimonas sp.]
MNCTAQRIPYRQTQKFTPIVLDYIDQMDSLRPFYGYPPSRQGVQKAVEQKKQVPVNRTLLVEQLQLQYQDITTSEKVKENIRKLADPNTFTITTAHQPNILTGPLYFLYKIIHAIKLANDLSAADEQHAYVPVFYMGSEDADLEELGHLYINGEKLNWETRQKGAVGRMKIDKAFLAIIHRIRGEVKVEPHGAAIAELMETSFREGVTVQMATFHFLNSLFADRGLIVLIPDNPAYKETQHQVFKDDLLRQVASGIVEKTSEKLGLAYKLQATPRDINLFYLKDDLRNRIEKVGDQYVIHDTDLRFSEEEILQELDNHPERFSPNVILRGIFQETLLPNIIFIGGGGEIAYWLQLKDLFEYYGIPYPVLVVRNSFLLIEEKWNTRIARTGFTAEDYFLTGQELLNRLVQRETHKELSLKGSLSEAESVFDKIRDQAKSIDPTLAQHTEALKVQAVKKLRELEKKMLRTEKKKFSAAERQINALLEHLFPGNGLQERKDNFIPYYAKWGKALLDTLYDQSLGFEQEFVMLVES